MSDPHEKCNYKTCIPMSGVGKYNWCQAECDCMMWDDKLNDCLISSALRAFVNAVKKGGAFNK